MKGKMWCAFKTMYSSSRRTVILQSEKVPTLVPSQEEFRAVAYLQFDIQSLQSMNMIK